MTPLREQSGPGTTPPVPTWCTSGSNSAALPASPSSTKGASPTATPITLEWNGRYPRRHRRSEKTRSNTRVPADGSRDGFGGAETHRSWSVARSSGKTARYWQGNGLQTRRRNAPRSFFALDEIPGTNLPVTPRRSLQRIRPRAGRRIEDARNHVQRGEPTAAPCPTSPRSRRTPRARRPSRCEDTSHSAMSRATEPSRYAPEAPSVPSPSRTSLPDPRRANGTRPP